MAKGIHTADIELEFPCEECGQRVRTGQMVCPGSMDTSLVGTFVQCSHCGHMNAIELDHIWRAHNAAMERMRSGGA